MGQQNEVPILESREQSGVTGLRCGNRWGDGMHKRYNQ